MLSLSEALAETPQGIGIQAEFERYDCVVRDGAKVFIEVGQALLAIKEGELWRAAFPSWEAYCLDRVGYTVRRVDQLIAGSKAAVVIENARSLGADLPSPASEFQLRPVAGRDGDAIITIWDEATTVYGEKPTSSQLDATARRLNGSISGPPTTSEEDVYRRQVYGSKVSLIIQRMNEGVLSPRQALAACDAIESCPPKVRGQILGIGVTNPVMIRELYRLYKKRSETYDEIVASGYLQFAEKAILASDATPAQLRDLLDEKYAEHRKRASAEKDATNGVVPVNLTLWLGDDARTIAALEHALGAERLRRICGMVLERRGNEQRAGDAGI